MSEKKKGRKKGGGAAQALSKLVRRLCQAGKSLQEKQLGYRLAMEISVLGTVSFRPGGKAV